MRAIAPFGVGVVESLNVGVPRSIQVDGRTVLTAIWKAPVDGPIALRGVNFQGDDQADRSVHGGPDKAVYAYSAEEIERWEIDLAVELLPGTFGENLTVRGLPVSEAVIGEQWAIGTTLIEVAQPRLPCYKFAEFDLATPAFRSALPVRIGRARTSVCCAKATYAPAIRSTW